MKKSYLLSLVCLFAASGGCFAMEAEEALLTRFIEQFKALPEEEKVVRIAREDLIDGYIAEYPDVEAVFEKHPGRKFELYGFIRELKPKIEEYCWYRLDDVYQQLLRNLQKKSPQDRGSVDIEGSQLRIFGFSKKEIALLEKMPPEQKEPFCVLASLIKAKAATQRPDPRDKPSNQRVSRLRKLIGAKA